MNLIKHCKVCGKKGLLTCDKCKKIVYCSRDCQFKDWNIHKFNCKQKLKPKSKSIVVPINNVVKIDKKKIPNANENNDFNALKRKSTNLLIEKKVVKRRTSIKFKKIEKKKVEEYKKLDDFNFLTKFYDIIFGRKKEFSSSNNSLGTAFYARNSFFKNVLLNEKNEKIKQIQNLLIEHRQFLIEKILLNSGKEKNFKYLNFMIDTYSRIESYIFNFLLLINFLYSLKDPISLIKADQALKLLGEELFIFSGNNKQGLLIYSIERIIKRFLEEIRIKNLNQSMNSITNVLRRFLYIISAIMKISLFLEDYIIYQKALAYYDEIFAISLKFLSSNRETERIILKCNLGFNIANIFIKQKFLNSALILYKNILQEQKKIEPCTFSYCVVYYNMSIIYFVMDKVKDSEFYLNEGFEKINKILENKSFIKQIDAFRKLVRLFILFYAEINLDKQNFEKATECLRIIIENMIDDNQSLRGRKLSSVSINELPNIKILKQLKIMLKNYIKSVNSYASKGGTRLNREEIFNQNNKILSAFESLYEVKFFSGKSEKAIFDEKMKKYINGFLNRIKAFCIEQEKKNKEKQKKNENLEPKKNKSGKIVKKNTFIPSKNKIENKIMKQPENNLPELDLTNIIKSNTKETEIDSITSHIIRGRNRTISKQVGKNILKERENKEKENINNNNNCNITNDKIYLNEELSNKIIAYLNEKMLKNKKILDNEKSISDFEYFFLLLTSLSYRQIEILNETQPVNIHESKFRNLPILFSKQFKNSLNPTQKRMFNKLRVLSLIRDKVLKDPNFPITIDNFNFSIFNFNINFYDFKIKNKNVPEILNGINRAERKNIHKINFNKYIIKSPSKNEELFSIFTGKEDEKDIVINFIHHKIKSISKESDSEDENDDSSKNDESEINFKYKNLYDINIIRKNLIETIKNKITLSEKTKNLYIEIIKSNSFIQLMNSLDSSTIQEADKNLDILIYYLKFVKKMSMKEYNKYKQLKSGTAQSNSSDNSFSIDISEKNFINNIKLSLNLGISNQNISMDKLKLNKKRLSSSFYKKNEENEYYYINNILFFNYKRIHKKSKSEDNII